MRIPRRPSVHGAAPVQTVNRWEAFASSFLPSDSQEFPFTSASAPDDGCLNTSNAESAVVAAESDPDERPTEVDGRSREVVNLRRQRVGPCSPPPGGPRPVLLIHTPRELLAYRNARPPVYVHHCPGGDTSLVAHHRHGLKDFRRKSSDILLDNTACSADPPPPPQTSALCACLGNEKYVPGTGYSETVVAPSCESTTKVDVPNLVSGQTYFCLHCGAAQKLRDEQSPAERRTQTGSSGTNNCASAVHRACRLNLHDVGQSSELRRCYSHKCYLRRRRISLVPTLGGLHEGHTHLMRQAACLSDEVWVTIFLNPLQFQHGKDFFSYPASIDEDIKAIQQVGVVSVVFVPQREALFPLDGVPTFPTTTSTSAQASGATAVVPCCFQDESASERRLQVGGSYAALGSPSTPTECSDGRRQLLQIGAASQGGGSSNAHLAGAASSTGTTGSDEGHSVCEKTKSRSDEQERSNASDSSRLFRMRVFFKDIEDVDGEGKRRPGFFGGIGTVVTQLLTLTRPTYLHLGLKDFQQVVCLKRLICGLGLDVLAVTHSTLREDSDGLSLASRNRRLSGAERTAAAKYYSVLQQLCLSYERGERRMQQLESEARTHAAAAGLHLYYLTFNRWQDGAPVAYKRRSNSVERISSPPLNAATGKKAEDAAGALLPPTGVKTQEHVQQQGLSHEGGKKDLSPRTSTLQLVKGTGQKEVKTCNLGTQADHGDTEEWILESPGKYCCTMAVRGNAETTLVDNVTLTDQPQFGDLLPPPLNVPWDRSSAATKHSFFGSFLLLGSLGMHLRYLHEDDLDVVLQAEEEDLKPRRDAPQLLFPPSFGDRTVAEGARQCLLKEQNRFPCPLSEYCGAAAEFVRPEMQQQNCVGACERTKRKRVGTSNVVHWLRDQRSRLFQVEGNSGEKMLWMAKEGDAFAHAATEDSCDSSGNQTNSKSCRVRAVGLFKYDLKEECSRRNKQGAYVGHTSSVSAAVADQVLHKEVISASPESAATTNGNDGGKISGREEPINYSNINQETTSIQTEGPRAACGHNRENATTDSGSEKGTVTERIAKIREQHRRRERFIGYVWAEEETEEEGEGGTRQQGSKSECSVGETARTILKIKRVFLKRERRRQTLGTHLLRSFIAATYKQLVQEQQQTAALLSRHEGHMAPEVLLAQRQETPMDAKKTGQDSRSVEKRRLEQCGSRDDAACKIRFIKKEQTNEERTAAQIAETEQSIENGDIKASGVEESTTEDRAEVEQGGKQKDEKEGKITCTVQLNSVPFYLVDVLKEGGFSVVKATTEMTPDAQNYCCMQASLAQWYKTFVLDAVV